MFFFLFLDWKPAAYQKFYSIQDDGTFDLDPEEDALFYYPLYLPNFLDRHGGAEIAESDDEVPLSPDKKAGALPHDPLPPLIEEDPPVDELLDKI